MNSSSHIWAGILIDVIIAIAIAFTGPSLVQLCGSDHWNLRVYLCSSSNMVMPSPIKSSGAF